MAGESEISRQAQSARGTIIAVAHSSAVPIIADRYPNFPDAKAPDGTSQDATGAIAPSTSHLRRVAKVLEQLAEPPHLEIVASAGVARESLPPHFSELRAMQLMEPAGARRRNPSGKCTAILRLADKGLEALGNG